MEMTAPDLEKDPKWKASLTEAEIQELRYVLITVEVEQLIMAAKIAQNVALMSRVGKFMFHTLLVTAGAIAAIAAFGDSIIHIISTLRNGSWR